MAGIFVESHKMFLIWKRLLWWKTIKALKSCSVGQELDREIIKMVSASEGEKIPLVLLKAASLLALSWCPSQFRDDKGKHGLFDHFSAWFFFVNELNTKVESPALEKGQWHFFSMVTLLLQRYLLCLTSKFLDDNNK